MNLKPETHSPDSQRANATDPAALDVAIELAAEHSMSREFEESAKRENENDTAERNGTQ